jgi:hypothetical protein
VTAEDARVGDDGGDNDTVRIDSVSTLLLKGKPSDVLD